MLAKITPIEVPLERKRVHFSFPDCPKSGRIALELRRIRKAYGSTVVFDGVDVHVARGDRIALAGPNGAGKSTLMRLLSGVEAPDDGTRIEGHNLVAQYFAQDEATRLDPDLTVYDTLGASSSTEMLPSIRNILGGFLLSADDVHKPVRVLAGGERTRLAVARMLLRPSNTLLLDEPTNHLDIDSTNVLLDALADFGGTVVFVSHDRYFVERIVTAIIEIGHGESERVPGTYQEYLWSKTQRATNRPDAGLRTAPARGAAKRQTPTAPPALGEPASVSREERRRRAQSERHLKRKQAAREKRIGDLEQRIADRERKIREIEETMMEPGFYDDRQAAQPVVNRHESLMWEGGDLMSQWEALQQGDGADAGGE